MSRFFNPAQQPYRDRYGFTVHPDLAMFVDEEGVNRDSLLDAGFAIAFVSASDDAPGIHGAYEDGDEYALARWDPTPPTAEGWRLVGLGDTESGPVATFVRPLD